MNNKKISSCIIFDKDIANIYLINRLLKIETIIIPVTEKTLDFKNQYFNDRYSLIFKMILGNIIECLNNGSNIFFYKYNKNNKYYYQLHKQLLRKMSYKCELYNLNFKNLRKINKNINIFTYIYYFLVSKVMQFLINKMNNNIKNNIGFEINKGSFERVRKSMIKKLLKNKGLINLIKTYIHYSNKYKNIFLDKPRNCMKVLKIDSLFSSFFIEKQLGNKNIEVYSLNNSRNTLYYIKKKINLFDGIIFVRDYYSLKQISMLRSLYNIANTNNKALMIINIDEKSNKINIKSKLDVLNDMIKIKTY